MPTLTATASITGNEGCPIMRGPVSVVWALRFFFMVSIHLLITRLRWKGPAPAEPARVNAPIRVVQARPQVRFRIPSRDVDPLLPKGS